MNSEKLKDMADEAHKLFQEEKYGAAIAKWDDIIPLLSTDDDKVEAYYHRGLAKFRMDNAVTDFNRALKINPRHKKAMDQRSHALGWYAFEGKKGEAPYLYQEKPPAAPFAPSTTSPEPQTPLIFAPNNTGEINAQVAGEAAVAGKSAVAGEAAVAVAGEAAVVSTPTEKKDEKSTPKGLWATLSAWAKEIIIGVIITVIGGLIIAHLWG